MSIKYLFELLSRPLASLKKSEKQDIFEIISRRELIKAGGTLLGASALLASAPAISKTSEAVAAPNTIVTLDIDLVTNGSSFISGTGKTITSIEDGHRGESFLVHGILYKGNTVDTNTRPDAPGRLGTWNCFGVYNLEGPAVNRPGPEPGFLSTQIFLFDNGDQLTTNGAESSSPRSTRVVTGGAGAFAGVTGVQGVAVIGVNPTAALNARYTFNLIKPKIKAS